MLYFGLGCTPGPSLLTSFSLTLHERLTERAGAPDVVGFKSVVCYRTGLDVSIIPDSTAELAAMCDAYELFKSRTNVHLRLANKALNDLVVRTTLKVAVEHNKPGIVPFFHLVPPHSPHDFRFSCRPYL